MPSTPDLNAELKKLQRGESTLDDFRKVVSDLHGSPNDYRDLGQSLSWLRRDHPVLMDKIEKLNRGELSLADLPGTPDVFTSPSFVTKSPSIGVEMLGVAASQNTVSILKLLLDSGASVNAKDDRSGKTILHHASESGRIAACSLLIERGVDLDARDRYGHTALMVAAGRGHKEVAELLLTSGADTKAVDKQGWTALHFAVYRGSENHEICQILLTAGADVDARDATGKTPLMLTASGNTNAMIALLEAGADRSLMFDSGHGQCNFDDLVSKAHDSTMKDALAAFDARKLAAGALSKAPAPNV